MNKVSSKNKGCANKKCSSQHNGAQVKKSEPPDNVNVKDIQDLKSKSKNVNGLVNGTLDDKKNHSNKTEKETSQEVDKSKINVVLTQKDESSAETVTSALNEAKCSNEGKKKSKSKKRNKNNTDQVETKASDAADETNQQDFDVLAFIRNKHKDEEDKAEVKEIATNIENLDVNKLESKEEIIEPRVENPKIEYVAYQSELQMPLIMKIIQKDLSEPYSIYTYRYFIHNWPNLCFLAMCEDLCVGAIVCKLDMHRKVIKRGYIAMLAVDKRYRKHGLGSTLVRRAIQEMITGDADEVVLETEITNKPALRLYEALGFVRDKRLFRYYLNGVDALRLKLWLR